jgi:bacteriocin biosynthesis cyclodehydratase domain-containing protein
MVTSSGPSEPVLRLRPGLAILAMDGAIQLRAGDEEIHVVQTDSPEVVEKLLHHLARGTPREAVLEGIGAEHAGLVDAVLEQLAAQRLLLDQPIDEADEITLYLSHFMGYAPHPNVRRPAGPVLVTGHRRCGDLLARALAEHAMDVRTTGDAGLSEDDLAHAEIKAIACIWEQPDLEMVLRVNAAACRGRTACLFVDLSHGRHATVGPFYVPGEGACYQCFRDRWRQNTAALAELEAAESAMLARHEPLVAYGILPAFRYQAAGMACGELFAFLARHRPVRTLNRAVTVDLEGMKLWAEPVWQIPWCPTCGSST